MSPAPRPSESPSESAVARTDAPHTPAAVRERLGWLLRTWRVHSAYAAPDALAAALGEAGAPVEPDALLRWEDGAEPASYAVLRTAEDVLGLRAGHLSDLAAYVHAFLPGPPPEWGRPAVDVTAAGFGEQVRTAADALVAADPTDGETTLRTCVELGHLLAAACRAESRGVLAPGSTDALLPDETWAALAACAVAALPRGVRAGHRAVLQAAHALCGVPAAGAHVVEQLRSYLADPAAQVLSLPISMLDRIPSPAAADLTLDLLEEGFAERDLRAAVWVAAQKLRRGELDAAQRSRLDLLLLAKWRSNNQSTPQDFAELIAVMPDQLRLTFATAATQVGRTEVAQALRSGELMPAAQAQAVSEAFARGVLVRAGEPTDPLDPVLVGLLRDAVFHLGSDHRHLAAVVLACSPYADAVATCALDLLDRDDVPELLRAHAAQLVNYTADDVHRSRLHARLGDQDDEIAFRAVLALGHLRYHQVSDLELRRHLHGLAEEQARTCLYSLGMTGSPALRALAAGKGDAPAWQQAAAAWWLRVGSALH